MTFLPRFSVNNPVLVNLLMAGLLVGGGISAFTLVRELFPESRPNVVSVTTLYPGATPAEVEKGISTRIEEEVKNIDGVDQVRTQIGEGMSLITIELRNDVDDLIRAVNDVKTAVDAIPRDELPLDAEETLVRKVEPQIPVISVSVYGDQSEKALKDMGRRLRDDLQRIDGITEVTLSGSRKDELSIEVRPEKLMQYGLSFMDVANAIRETNLDLPAGRLKLEGANVAIRTLGEEDRAEGLAEMIIRSDPSGKIVRVRDVATVIDGLEDTDISGRFNGKPAVTVMVSKTPRQDAIEIAAKVKAFVAGKTGGELELTWLERMGTKLGIKSAVETIYTEARANPYAWTAQLGIHNDLAYWIEGRLDLLTRNGLWGLGFVFASLLVFLNWRVAFWVMVGLLLSVLGTLMAMKATGQTLNMIAMFGLIVVLGMLVDDAIVVGENVYRKVEEGVPPLRAAVDGAVEVAWPVTAAIITTIIAFSPLLFIEGQMGDFMGVLPVIVICALSISLLESLVILPAHLREGLKPMRSAETTPGRVRLHKRMRAQLRETQDWFLKKLLLRGYTKLVRGSLAYRYATMTVMIGALAVAGAAVLGGHIPWVFIQKMDSELLTASLRMPVGTPIARTEAAISQVEEAFLALPELRSVQTILGAQVSFRGPDSGLSGRNSHLAQVIAELYPIEQREANGQRSSEAILKVMRQSTDRIQGKESLKYGSIQGGPGGTTIQLELLGEDLDGLKEAGDWIKARLATYAGVFDIADDADLGQREVKIRLRDSGRALGLTTRSLGMQVRGAFYGLEVRKVQRNREDVRIMVRYPEADRRNLYKIDEMWVATPDGTLVPFREVASLEEGTGYATIRRRNQQRAVTITADIEEGVGNSNVISGQIKAEFEAHRADFPGVSLQFGGQQLEMAKSFRSLKPNSVLALLGIFAILAALFKSYIQPVIVMAVIPFGFIGAVVGHWVMGFPFTMLSAIGLVALTGIVVNDSLILVDFINHRVRAGMPVYDAIIESGQKRLRPILLTSITTILGLAPLMAERSVQAQFLIPMGISICFGLAFATGLTLVVVPCLYLIVEDARGMLHGIRHAFDRPKATEAI